MVRSFSIFDKRYDDGEMRKRVNSMMITTEQVTHIHMRENSNNEDGKIMRKVFFNFPLNENEDERWINGDSESSETHRLRGEEKVVKLIQRKSKRSNQIVISHQRRQKKRID